MSRALWLSLFATGALSAGCQGYLDGSSPVQGGPGSSATTDPSMTSTAGSAGQGNNNNQTTTDPNQPPTAQVTCTSTKTETVGHRALRRLTNGELEATVRATLGLDATAWPGVSLPSDTGSADGFNNNVDSLTVTPDYAKATYDQSKSIATTISGAAVLSKLVPCAAQGDAACADTFVSTVGSKLYRRPLTDAEKARYKALYTKISGAKEDFKSFAYWATIAMLQSPSLIYRSEIGEAGGAGFKLSQYEIASELSYTFTGGPPADALLGLAAANQLGTADQIETAARSLVFDGQNVRPAFRNVLLQFTDQWLGLTGFSNIKKDAGKYPDFSTDVQASMAEETRRFFSAIFLEDKGNAASLFTAPFTFVDKTLAAYYGFGTATDDNFVRVTRPANWGIGLLSQGSVLATQANSLTTSPTRRGHLVRTKLLCGVVPPPPPVVGQIPAPTATQTTRQRYEELHTANASCKSCHALMDQIGFSLEHLDAAGRYRETENTFPINDVGTVTGTSAGDLKVGGIAELGTTLSKLPEVTDCVSSYLGAYALGMNHDSATCLVATAAGELRNGASLLDFYVRMARSEHFRTRQ